MGGHELRKKTELRRGRSSRPAMNNQHQRIFSFVLKIGRVNDYPILLEIVGPFPFEPLRSAQGERGDFMIEIGEALRNIRHGRHVIQLGRLRRRDAGESDIALAADESIHPKSPGWTDVTERQLLRGAVKRWQAERSLRGVVGAEQQRIST